jgi:nicotinic acetylcholine receptor
VYSLSQLNADLNLLTNETKIALTEYRANSVWDLLDTHVKRISYYWGDELIFLIRLRRKPLYYLFNMAVPVFILSALTVLTFCLPNDSGEKLSFIATVFLSFMVLANQIASSLPTSSDSIPLLGKWPSSEIATLLLVAL